MTPSPASTPLPASMPTLPTADEAIAALVRAEGDYHLAAEKLRIERHQLVAIIAQDQTAADLLNTQLRTLAILRTFESFNLAHVAASGALSTADPKDLFKFATTLGETLEKLTAPRATPNSPTNINITEYILKLLPEDVRESVIAMLPSASASWGAPAAADSDEPIQLSAPRGVAAGAPNRPAAHLRDAHPESESA